MKNYYLYLIVCFLISFSLGDDTLFVDGSHTLEVLLSSLSSTKSLIPIKCFFILLIAYLVVLIVMEYHVRWFFCKRLEISIIGKVLTDKEKSSTRFGTSIAKMMPNETSSFKVTKFEINPNEVIPFEVTKVEECSNDVTPLYNKEKQTMKLGCNLRVLLVMTDKVFGNNLKNALSEDFLISILESPDLAISISVRQKPNVIIIDEYINGESGDKLCSRIKSDKAVADIPVIMLIENCDNENYASHLGCGANRLLPRIINTCKLKVDISMLIANHLYLLGQTTQLPAEMFSYSKPIQREMDMDEIVFMDKIRELMEKNLGFDKYGVEKLAVDMRMSHTSLYCKIMGIIGYNPEKYMYEFKMKRSVELLETGQYSIGDIAGMLGFCDAGYFGKRFKKFYHISPSKYIDSLRIKEEMQNG